MASSGPRSPFRGLRHCHGTSWPHRFDFSSGLVTGLVASAVAASSGRTSDADLLRNSPPDGCRGSQFTRILGLLPTVPLVRLHPPLDPVTNPVTNPALDPVVNPAADPVTNPAVAVDPAVDPVTNPAIDLALDPVTNPSVVVDPVTNPATDSALVPALDPVTNPSVDPAIDPATNPAAVVDPVTNPAAAVDPAIDPVVAVDPITNPAVNSVVDSSVDAAVAAESSARLGHRRDSRRDTLGETLLTLLQLESDWTSRAAARWNLAAGGTRVSEALDARHCSLRCSSIRLRRASSTERHDFDSGSSPSGLAGGLASRISMESAESAESESAHRIDESVRVTSRKMSSPSSVSALCVDLRRLRLRSTASVNSLVLIR